jgi:hypothetical protein
MTDKLDPLRRIDVEAAKRITGRECGNCSLCCRLLDVPEAGKQTAQWCPHCRPGKGGCSIYAARPQACRHWACSWLVNSDFGDEWFPKACGIVVDMHRMEDDSIVMRFHVDPRTPDNWRKEPFYSQIKQAALRGLRGDIGQQFGTIISIAKKPWLLVLPNKEVEWGIGVTMQTGPDEFEFLRLKSAEAAQKFISRMRAMEEIVVETRDQHPDLAPAEVLDRAAPRLCELFAKEQEDPAAWERDEP